MKNINKINISSIEYAINYVNEIDDEMYGKCDGLSYFNEKKIEIDKNLSGQARKKILIHEIIECINDEYYIKLNHRQVELLGAAIYDTFLRNDLEGLFE